MRRTAFPKPRTAHWVKLKNAPGYWCQRFSQNTNSEICRSKIDMNTNGCRKCGGCPEPVEED